MCSTEVGCGYTYSKDGAKAPPLCFLTHALLSRGGVGVARVASGFVRDFG